MPAFNLVVDACLPLRPRRGGPPASLSLSDALLRAEEFEGLVVELPTMVPALLRQLLLPVVADALGAPKTRGEWKRRFRAGRFSEEEQSRLRSYLGEWSSRFGLFDSEAPFAQVAGLSTTKGETKGAALLVATAATGNNVPLFSSRSEGDSLPLTPGAAMRWLLHTHCWDTAAIKTGAVGDPRAKSGKTTGNPTGPLGQLGVVVPTGRTLYETLLLNLPISSAATAGTPQWRRKPAEPAWTARAADGLLDLWTWQSRRIRLVPEATPHGVRVTRVVLSAGDRLTPPPEWEPHTAWTFQGTAKSRTGAVRRPRRHTPGKAAWRGLEAWLSLERRNDEKGSFETSLLLEQLGSLQEADAVPVDYPLRLETYGIVYGTQSAVIEDVLYDAIPLPVAALRGGDSEVYGMLLDVAQQAEELAQAVNNVSADLRRAIGADPIPWDKGQRPGDLVLHTLDPLVRRLLAGAHGVGDDEEILRRGQLAWEQLAWRRVEEVTDPLFAAAPAGTFTGREAVRAGTTMTYRLGTAEHNFRSRLGRILPLASQARRAAAAARRDLAHADQDAAAQPMTGGRVAP